MKSAYYIKKSNPDKENIWSSLLPPPTNVRKNNKKLRSKKAPTTKSIHSISKCLKDNMTRITYRTVESLSKSTQPHDRYVYDKLCQSLIRPVLTPNLSFDTEKQNEFVNNWLQYHDLGICSVDSFSIMSQQE